MWATWVKIMQNRLLYISNSPSEPVYVSRPNSKSENDGAVLSLVSPIKDMKKRAFVVVLKAENLEEISRIYLPEHCHVPVGFHSNWMPIEPDKDNDNLKL